MARRISALAFLLLFAGAARAQTINVYSNNGSGTSSTISGSPSSTNQAALFLDEVACDSGVNCNGVGNSIGGGWGAPISGTYSTGSFSLFSNFFTGSGSETVGETWTGGTYAWLAALDFFPTSAGTTGKIFLNGLNQYSSVTSVSGTTSVSFPFSFAVTAGDQFLITINTNGGSFTAGVNDTASDAYDQIGNPNGVSGNLMIRTFICFAPAGGTPTITVGLGGIATNIDINVHEFALTGGHLLAPAAATPVGRKTAFIIAWKHPWRHGAWDRRRKTLVHA